MKRKYKAALLFLAAGILAGCSRKEETGLQKQTMEEATEKTVSFTEPLPKTYQGTLTMWGWDEDYYHTVTEAFQKQYPNVKFVYTAVEHKDLPLKYRTALSVGGELPDIGWSIIDSRGEVFELDMWEPLEQEPYCFDLSEVYAYLHPHMVNTKGNVCGIEQSLSPAGLAYRRDLAKQYLGTDDPKELEAMMPDWESFIRKGEEVYEKSGGEVYMCFSLGDIRQLTLEQQEKAWASEDGVDVEETFGRSFRLVERFRDAHVSDNLIAWTPAWNDAFQEDNHIFTACAAWSVKFTIESYDPEGEKTGRWGLMSAPEGNVNWGGTAMGITRTCKDKRLAWEFLKFAALSVEGAEALNSMALMTTAKKPYEEKPALKSYQSAWFGAQDLGAYYLDNIIPSIKTRAMTPEDGAIHDSLTLILQAMNEDRNMSAEDALAALRMILKEKLPMTIK